MSDPFIGEIRLFAGTYAPAGWAICDGSAIAIDAQQALYMLIGTTYGGDGMTTFALPDLRGQVPVGIGQGNGLSNTYALGTDVGGNGVALSAAQMPEHTHAISVSSASATTNIPGETVTFAAVATGSLFYVDTSFSTPIGSANFAAAAISMAGSNAPHANIMSSLGINFIICMSGIFPPHS
jgi:microcystin-dependent protein